MGKPAPTKKERKGGRTEIHYKLRAQLWGPLALTTPMSKKMRPTNKAKPDKTQGK